MVPVDSVPVTTSFVVVDVNGVPHTDSPAAAVAPTGGAGAVRRSRTAASCPLLGVVKFTFSEPATGPVPSPPQAARSATQAAASVRRSAIKGGLLSVRR